ncbi:MAG: type II toxin-antitoxin system VapC family toxin [Actinomycetota bacterium]
MILPDTSAWVEEIRHTGSTIDRALESLLRSGADVTVTEPVVMELLAGARSKDELRATRKRMLAFPMLRVDNLVTYERAAVIWRLCRAGGEPVRNTMDCLIAAVAIREGASILHADRDFDVMARHAGLLIEPVA